MNEKYTHNILGSVFKDGELFALTQGEAQATKLCIELNALHEENEQLTKEIDDLKEERDYYKGHCESEGLLYD